MVQRILYAHNHQLLANISRNTAAKNGGLSILGSKFIEDILTPGFTVSGQSFEGKINIKLLGSADLFLIKII